jgi:hypothetical protein
MFLGFFGERSYGINFRQPRCKPLDSINWLIANLLCGAGLRLHGAWRLRVKDLDFGFKQIVVRQAEKAAETAAGRLSHPHDSGIIRL